MVPPAGGGRRGRRGRSGTRVMAELASEFGARLGAPAAAVLERLLAQVADPAAAARGLEHYLRTAGPEAEARLRGEPGRARPLLTIFGHSRFLAETLQRNPDWAEWLAAPGRLDGAPAAEELARELAQQAATTPTAARAETLARFKKREYLRIVVRDLEGLATLAETTEDLSNLADALLAQAVAWSWNDLAARFGTPLGERGEIAALAVIGLGKLGGGELNYSSDIDLMFIYSAEGQSDGHGAAGATTNREFFSRLAQNVARYVSEPTAEGAAYRVDLRLRPGGREGEIALPLSQAASYYCERARPWEWQMLIKARGCAGSSALAREFARRVADRVYPPAGGPEAVAAVRAARERIGESLRGGRARGRRSERLDVKLDYGGIRDIEFLTQGLQRLHGGRDPWVRGGNTLRALQRLHDKGWLRGAQFQTLGGAYALLREVEHRLQLRLGQQTHSLPEDAEAMAALARGVAASRALGRWAAAGAAAPLATPAWLEGELARAMGGVGALVEALLPAPPAATAGGFALASPTAARAGAENAAGGVARGEARSQAASAQEPPAADAAASGARGEATLLAPAGACGEAEAWPANSHELRRPAWWRTLNWAAAETKAAGLSEESREAWRRRVAASGFLAAAIALHPELAAAVARPLPPPDERQAELLPDASWPAPEELDRVLWPSDPPGGSWDEAMEQLRRRHQRRLVRYVAGELLRPAPPEVALRRLTAWAETAVRAALRLALARQGLAPERFSVLALGRLGLGEFDLFSDADLVFLAAEEDLPAAARAAAGLIELLASYTRAGVVFPVDARLRPEGSQGDLVHTPRALAEYFRQRADVWEAVTYLKARPLAGGAVLAAEALAGVRAGIRERFHSPEIRPRLREMRARLERESGTAANPLKTGPGAIYDLEFLLAAIALEAPAAGAAGVANIAEDWGGRGLGASVRAVARARPDRLPAPLAEELGELARVLRAADHALRIILGKPPTSAPTRGAQAAAASDLLARALERKLPPGGIAEEVAAATRRLRALYNAGLAD